ncbi:hypothetical protein [Synechococcus sp. HK05]|uniref:hypothetical protein n=1 Tax=Synechococcus sp. HK05 TaxID=2725975 RepID=UPI0020CB2588|nr:hypothetical protein [Synechococcus sp. HK05]
MPSFPIRRLIGACLVASAASVLAAPAQASMIDQIIFKKCSEAMADDFQKAGKTPPDGMVADTCNCVVEQVGKRQTIEQAKTFCSKQSLQKYGQP